MDDEHFFDISSLRLSRNVSSCPWRTQNEATVRQQQPLYEQTQFIDNHVLSQNINGGHNAPVPVRYYWKEYIFIHVVGVQSKSISILMLNFPGKFYIGDIGVLKTM